jgi:hypothetical protein
VIIARQIRTATQFRNSLAHCIPLAAPPARQPDHETNPNVTKAALDEIAVGMLRDEVLKILGQPAVSDSYPTISILGFYGDEGNELVWISPKDDCVFDAKWTPLRASVSAEAFWEWLQGER